MQGIFLADGGTHAAGQQDGDVCHAELHCRDDGGDILRKLAVHEADVVPGDEFSHAPDEAGMNISGHIKGESVKLETQCFLFEPAVGAASKPDRMVASL